MREGFSGRGTADRPGKFTGTAVPTLQPERCSQHPVAIDGIDLNHPAAYRSFRDDAENILGDFAITGPMLRQTGMRSSLPEQRSTQHMPAGASHIHDHTLAIHVKAGLAEATGGSTRLRVKLRIVGHAGRIAIPVRAISHRSVR